jgi:hypothetical protein
MSDSNQRMSLLLLHLSLENLTDRSLRRTSKEKALSPVSDNLLNYIPSGLF